MPVVADRGVETTKLEALQRGRETAHANGGPGRANEPRAVCLNGVVAGWQRVDRKVAGGVGERGDGDRAERRDHGPGDRTAVVVADHASDAAAGVPDGLVLHRLGARRRGTESFDGADGADDDRRSERLPEAGREASREARNAALHQPTSVLRL